MSNSDECSCGLPLAHTGPCRTDKAAIKKEIARLRYGNSPRTGEEQEKRSGSNRPPKKKGGGHR